MKTTDNIKFVSKTTCGGDKYETYEVDCQKEDEFFFLMNQFCNENRIPLYSQSYNPCQCHIESYSAASKIFTICMPKLD